MLEGEPGEVTDAQRGYAEDVTPTRARSAYRPASLPSVPMAGSPVADRVPSLLGITVRRSAVTGRTYLILGTIWSVLYAVALSFASPSSFAATYPLLLPLFSVLGAMGALMVFTSDRVKGVFEYLVAYGVSPRRLFANVLLTTVLLLTIVLGSSLAVGLGVEFARQRVLTAPLLEALLTYSLPMAYVSAAFAATVGMFWTSLSSPREGMNSPIGFVPILGIGPSLITLVTVGIIEASHPVPVVDITSTAVAVVAVVVIALLSMVERLLPRERFLSPA